MTENKQNIAEVLMDRFSTPLLLYEVGELQKFVDLCREQSIDDLSSETLNLTSTCGFGDCGCVQTYSIFTYMKDTPVDPRSIIFLSEAGLLSSEQTVGILNTWLDKAGSVSHICVAEEDSFEPLFGSLAAARKNIKSFIDRPPSKVAGTWKTLGELNPGKVARSFEYVANALFAYVLDKDEFRPVLDRADRWTEQTTLENILSSYCSDEQMDEWLSAALAHGCDPHAKNLFENALLQTAWHQMAFNLHADLVEKYSAGAVAAGDHLFTYEGETVLMRVVERHQYVKDPEMLANFLRVAFELIRIGMPLDAVSEDGYNLTELLRAYNFLHFFHEFDLPDPVGKAPSRFELSEFDPNNKVVALLFEHRYDHVRKNSVLDAVRSLLAEGHVPDLFCNYSYPGEVDYKYHRCAEEATPLEYVLRVWDFRGPLVTDLCTASLAHIAQAQENCAEEDVTLKATLEQRQKSVRQFQETFG